MKKRTLAAILLAACLASAAGVACYPNPTDSDPIHMIWDEDPTPGFHKLQLLEHAEGLRVFWWNLAYGLYNQDGSLDQNIQELIRSEAAPDVIAFSEYKEMAFKDAKTLEQLRAKYPFSVYVPYESGRGTDGVGVFSAFPFTRRIIPNLDWTPLGSSAEEAAAYRASWASHAPETAHWWDRPYLKLDIQFLGRTVGLVAVHLLEPWGQIHQAYGGWTLARDMLTSEDSPLAYQSHRLKDAMKEDFGENLDSEPLMLIGDFNTPKSLFGITTECYGIVSEGMEDLFTGQPKTFPAKSAPDNNQEPFKTIGGIKIDHAFVSGGFTPVGAAAVPLKGSDHYPIYVIAKPE